MDPKYCYFLSFDDERDSLAVHVNPSFFSKLKETVHENISFMNHLSEIYTQEFKTDINKWFGFKNSIHNEGLENGNYVFLFRVPEEFISIDRFKNCSFCNGTKYSPFPDTPCVSCRTTGLTIKRNWDLIKLKLKSLSVFLHCLDQIILSEKKLPFQMGNISFNVPTDESQLSITGLINPLFLKKMKGTDSVAMKAMHQIYSKLERMELTPSWNLFYKEEQFEVKSLNGAGGFSLNTTDSLGGASLYVGIGKEKIQSHSIRDGVQAIILLSGLAKVWSIAQKKISLLTN